jgi:hypothetical protein
MVVPQFEAIAALSVGRSGHNNLIKVANVGSKYELQLHPRRIRLLSTTTAFGLIMQMVCAVF